MGWSDGFSELAKGIAGAASDLGSFVSNNLGTIFDGYLNYAQAEASKAVSAIAPPPPAGTSLPKSSLDSGPSKGKGVPASGGADAFPMATVLLLVGSVVVVALVFKK